MPATGIDDTANAVPVLRYRDLSAAVEWLCRNLGFEEHLVVRGEAGSLRLAQVALGGNIVMLAPVQTTKLDRLMVQPDEIGGATTQITYFFVADTAAHFERAKAAGVEIVLDEDDKDHVKRSYSCRDPEGHIWSFGTYDPRRQTSSRRQPPDRAVSRDRTRATGIMSAVSMGFSFTLIAAVAVMGWVVMGWSQSIDPTQRPEIEFTPVAGAPAKAIADPAVDAIEALRTAKVAAEQDAVRARDLLSQALKRESDEKAANAELQQAMAQALAKANAAREEAERTAEQVAEQARVLLAREQSDREAGRRSVDEALAQVESERRAREAAESSAAEARGQLAKERNARESAQRSRKELEARLARERSVRKAPQPKSSATTIPGIP